jgi:Putative DnaT-like ssDNA binding protein
VAAVVDDTVGGEDANSYESVAEFLAYLETKTHTANVPNAAAAIPYVIQATRLLDNALAPPDLAIAYARGLTVAFGWTGAAATVAQALAWPRTGMFTRTGAPDLKHAVSEIAYALLATDLTETDTIAALGITSVKAGSVAVTFKAAVDGATTKTPASLPDAALACLVPSWYLTVVGVPIGGSGFEFAVT